MKRLDLHIHTKPTVSDSHFTFSMEILRDYVERASIDGIAITNHNLFDINQYQMISKELSDICVVLPGIEINIGNPIGHLICIGSADDVAYFSSICKKIESRIQSNTDTILYEEFKNIFTDLGKYLWIPHWEKSPSVTASILNKMSPHILCGEVKSPKKFLTAQNSQSSYTPVYFSDFRPKEDISEYLFKQTLFDIDEITIQSIKKCLSDKSKVALLEEEGHSLFQALPNLRLSTGLNVILGERSSGKSHTLDELAKYNNNVKYIRQFELLETSDWESEKAFNDRLSKQSNDITNQYFQKFINAVSEICNTTFENDEEKLDEYVESLIKYANETDRADAFSKCNLYVESEYRISNLDNLSELIKATQLLIDNQEYKTIIEKYINRKELINLYKDLVNNIVKGKCINLKKEWVNSLIKDIKIKLSSKTAATKIVDVNLYDLQMYRIRIQKFNELANLIKKKCTIKEETVGKFTMQITKQEFNNASKMNAVIPKKIALSSLLPIYKENPFQFLIALKENTQIDAADYYKFFAHIEYNILNQYGTKLSGGERAEFNLLNKINDARHYDILLIDELESSFDNIFLKNQVNEMIKEISKEVTVVLVTHNNTVGASIKPDFIVYTKRTIINNQAKYDLYSGLATSKELLNAEGKAIKNIDITLDCLEAGKEAYIERRKEYEILDH